MGDLKCGSSLRARLSFQLQWEQEVVGGITKRRWSLSLTQRRLSKANDEFTLPFSPRFDTFGLQASMLPAHPRESNIGPGSEKGKGRSVCCDPCPAESNLLTT